RVKLVFLAGAKDVNALHCADPLKFLTLFLVALDEAEPWADVETARETDAAAAAWRACAPLAEARRILPRVLTTLRTLAVVGERRIIQLLYLAATSRLSQHPVSVAIKGVSSIGKSYLCELVLELFPAAATYTLTAMSERALAYSREPLAHRMLVIYE